MEWVETTGRTVDDAKDAALDQLGVDEQEAEFELLEEPRSGLFGRTRGEARVRARVRPRQPRAKVERGNRRRRSSGDAKSAGRTRGGRGKGGRSNEPPAERTEATTPAASTAASTGARDRTDQPTTTDTAAGDGDGTGQGGGNGRATAKGGRSRGSRGGRTRNAPPAREEHTEQHAPPAATERAGDVPTTKEQAMTDEDVTVEEQAEIVEGFLEGLVDAFGVDAEIHQERIDDDTIELDLVGSDLGLLIGPKGRTLWAIQELSRTVVQRQATGTHHGRVRIDVGGYRQRRKEALERFTRQLASEVQESGVARSLEPMGAADRKIVHDTVNEMDGISTTSEGEEPRRRVVIVPGD